MQKYRRMLIIGLALGLLAFIAVTLLSDVSQLFKFALAFPWLAMIPVLMLRLGNWALRFGKWHYYLRLVGVRGLAVRDSAAIFVSGLAMAASPGKAAELLKAFIVHNLTGTPVAAVIPVIAAERLTDGIAVVLLMIGSIAALAKPEYLPVAYVSLAIFAVGIVVLSIRPLCMALLDLLSRLPLIGRYAVHFRAFYESSYKIVQLPNLAVGSRHRTHRQCVGRGGRLLDFGGARQARHKRNVFHCAAGNQLFGGHRIGIRLAGRNRCIGFDHQRGIDQLRIFASRSRVCDAVGALRSIVVGRAGWLDRRFRFSAKVVSARSRRRDRRRTGRKNQRNRGIDMLFCSKNVRPWIISFLTAVLVLFTVFAGSVRTVRASSITSLQIWTTPIGWALCATP